MLSGDPPYDTLWPRRDAEDPYVKQYLAYVYSLREKYHKKGLTLRVSIDGEPQSRLFTSVENRDILERALLQKGVYICSLPSMPNERLKPMDCNHTISLGYGAFFATCYNISNNCLLAF